MQGFTGRFATKSKLIAGGVVALLALGTAVGAFAAHGGTSTPLVELTPTTTETAAPTDTPAVDVATETATPEATETAAATETSEPTQTAEATETATETPGATDTPEATETPEPAATALHDQSGCVKIAPHDHRELGGNKCGWQKHPEKHGLTEGPEDSED